MPPVDLHLLARGRLEADVGRALNGSAAECAQIIAQDRDAARIATSGDALTDDHGRGLRVEFQKPCDLLFEGVQFAAGFGSG